MRLWVVMWILPGVLAMSVGLPAQAEAQVASRPGCAREGQLSLRAAVQPPPVATSACPDLRPGAWIYNPDGSSCTMGFLFAASDGRRYATTAGHCALGDVKKQATWRAGLMPVRDVNHRKIGDYRFGVLSDRTDFALIQLLPGIVASAGVCNFGGPTGIDSAITSSPTVVHHFGWGIGIGDQVPGRTGIASRGLPNPDKIYAELAAAPGDSGSPVIADDGRAIGLLVELHYDVSPAVQDGIGVVRLQYPLSLVRQTLGIRLQILTARLD